MHTCEISRPQRAFSVINITLHFAPRHNPLVLCELNLETSFQTSGICVPHRISSRTSSYLIPNLKFSWLGPSVRAVLPPAPPRVCVFGRAGGLGGLRGHHVCIPSFLSLPPLCYCSSWLLQRLPDLGSPSLSSFCFPLR